MVYKEAGGSPTVTGLLDPADTSRLARLGTCPVYLQRYIAGDNVRVHVVGTEMFATESAGDAVDYRCRPSGSSSRRTRRPASRSTPDRDLVGTAIARLLSGQVLPR